MKTKLTKPICMLLLFIVTFISMQCSKDDSKSPSPNPNPTNNIGKYTIDAQMFSCKCFTDNVGYVFLDDNNNDANSFGIRNMPAESSGTFNFGKNFTGNTILPMGSLLDSRSAYSGYG